MNCTTCNTPLETNARFCPRCGTAVPAGASNSAGANPSPQYQPASMHESPTLPQDRQNEVPTVLPGYQQVPQPSYYQPGRPQEGMFSREENIKPRHRGGCFVRSLIILIVLLLVIIGGWFFAVRPYLNNLAQTKLDGVLSDAVNNIPPPIAQLPGGPVVISEKAVNTLLVLVSAPNDMVKDPRVHFTSTVARMDFQIYGFPCAVTGTPQVNQGHLVFTNVNIEGIASLILTPDEITAIVNRHLADAQTKISHPIDSVQLKDQELDLVLGPPGGSGQPTLP